MHAMAPSIAKCEDVAPLKQLSQFYRGFSCPQEDFDPGLAEMVVVEHARETVRRFLARSEALSASTAGLVPLLQKWLEHDTTYETVWDFTFGECAKTVFGDTRADAVQVATALGLQLSSRGCPGTWKAQWHPPTRLIAGRYLLPLCARLCVSGDGSRGELVVRIGSDNSGRE